MTSSPRSSRALLIEQSSWVGIVGNAILALLKIVFGILAHSAAVLADGIDSASDIIGSLITLYVSRVSETPPDLEHPWGHRRVEAIATKVLAFILLFEGMQLVVSTVDTLIRREPRPLPGELAIVVTLISIVGKAAIAAYKYRIARTTQSDMVRADALNMRNDILLSTTVLISLVITAFTGISLVDSIVGLLLGVWIIKSGIDIFLETNTELMDSLPNGAEVYSRLFAAVDNVAHVYNPHKARVRKLNDLYDITLDVEVEGSLTVFESHVLIQEVEANIKKAFPQTFDIVIHVEPRGNDEDEQFGISGKAFEV